MVEIEVDRGLTFDECIALCKAPKRLPRNATEFQMWKHLRDEILIRLLYETFARIGELLKVQIQDTDFDNCAIFIKHPKGKYNKKTDKVKREPRWVFFSEDTRDLITRYLGGRKRGYLTVSNRRKSMSTRTAERIVNYYASLIGIQKTRGYADDKEGRRRVLNLVTCKALREAGERHTDVAGADRDITARIAGHTVETKETYYKRTNFDEMRAVVRKYHPLMMEDDGRKEGERSCRSHM